MGSDLGLHPNIFLTSAVFPTPVGPAINQVLGRISGESVGSCDAAEEQKREA